VLFNKRSLWKNISLFVYSSLLSWLTLRAGVIKVFRKGWHFSENACFLKNVFTFYAGLLMHHFIKVSPWCISSAPPNPLAPLIKWREFYWCYFSVIVFPLSLSGNFSTCQLTEKFTNERSLHFYWYKCDFSRDLAWQEFDFATWIAIR